MNNRSRPRHGARAVAVGAIVAALAGMALPVHAQGTPRVVAMAGGSVQVTFRNGCVVTFDARGRESGRTVACSRAHRDRARDAYEGFRRDQGWHGGVGWWGTPTVTVQANGFGRVRFRDGCTVDYNRQGQRRDHSADCRTGQLERADEAMADYRLEHGWDSVGPGGWWGSPEVTLDRHGAGQVRFRNGCVVDYNRRGDRVDRSRDCRDEQMRRADLAMAEVRREHGSGGGSSGGSQGGGKGTVTVGPDGNTQVRMSSRCTVRYDRDGRRLDIAADCTPAQLKAANEIETRFRIGRLNQQGQGD